MPLRYFIFAAAFLMMMIRRFRRCDAFSLITLDFGAFDIMLLFLFIADFHAISHADYLHDFRFADIFFLR